MKRLIVLGYRLRKRETEDYDDTVGMSDLVLDHRQTSDSIGVGGQVG